MYYEGMFAIDLNNVSYNFGEREVLREISFQVKSGHIHGLLGPNGAGKTTTMKLIAGLKNCKTGSISVFNSNVSNVRADFNTFGILLEEPPLYEELSVTEYLRFICRLKRISKKEINNRIDYCIEVLDLDSVKNRIIGNLSKGFKQRIGIAQAIIHMPKIVILDEPTVGLDPYSVIEIRNLILKLKDNHTVLLSSHLLHEMGLVCDEVTIIDNGKVLASGTIENIQDTLAGNNLLVVKAKYSNEQWEQFIENKLGIHINKKEQVDNYYLYELLLSHDISKYSIIIEEMVNHKMNVFQVERKESTLEEIFVRVIDK